MKTLSFALIGALTFGSMMMACGSVDVHTVVVDSAPVARAKSFSFALGDDRSPKGFESSARSRQVVELMKPTITDILTQKGYVAAAPDTVGDLTIVCAVGRRAAEEERSRRAAAFTGESYERDYTEGAIVINVVDGAGKLLWHGSGETEIDPQKPDNALVKNIVQRVLSSFPVRPQ